MEYPQTPPTHDIPEGPSLTYNIGLAIVAGSIAAVIGGWLMNLATYFFYIPVIPGFVVGLVLSRTCKVYSIVISVIAAFLGFAGMVWGDALTYNLIDYPGILNYLTHFYLAATPMKVLFWLLNAGLAAWYTRDIGRTFVPVLPGVSCPHCGQSVAAGNRFCGSCGGEI